MPSFELTDCYLDECLDKDTDIPYQFGFAFDVEYTLDDGLWQDVEDGRVWTIKIVSSGALSLNFILDNFSLPQGGTLEIVNKECDVLYGPVFNDAIPSSGHFLTDLIKGDEAIFFLYEPKEYKGQSSLSIRRIIHGYKMCDFNESDGLRTSSSCNIDVACYPQYNKESKSVGRVLLSGGTSFCSGSLMMTTDMSFKPYFLTAFHCIDDSEDGVISSDEENAVHSWLFKFNYKKMSCNGNTLATSYSYNGAILKAAWINTDFALVEITSNLSSNPNLVWLGWDNSNNVPTSGIGIHHPRGDVMKISIENDTLQNCMWSGDYGTNEYNHWLVNYDYGIAEGGSSGSPLLNQNKRVVGQLHGGLQYNDPCLQTIRKYGKFNESWIGGGTDNTRLSSWLDSIGTGQTTIDSSFPLTISGPDIPCGYSTYFVDSLPAGYDVIWSWKKASDITLFQSLTDTTQCVINNFSHAYIKNTLLATIYRNGQLIRTLEKNIDTGINFIGTIQQSAGFIGDYYYPGMPATNFHSGNKLFALCGTTITLTSPDFSAATITHSGNARNWIHSGNTITFNFRYLPPVTNNGLNSQLPNSGVETITGTYPGNCEVFQFKVFGTTPPTPLLSTSPNTLYVTAGRNGYLFSMYETDNESNNGNVYKPLSASLPWKLTIINSLTGTVVYDNKISGHSFFVDSSGWQYGIYIARAIVNGEILTSKFNHVK